MDINIQRKNLPQFPGVYIYYNKDSKVIYVGKAKNIKKRVNSYFTKNHPDLKTKLLVNEIKRIEYIVTNSELEALLLENRLIKKYKPKYNILLKDGKSYPYICIKKEPFPRVFYTRKKLKDGSFYFGPYPNVQAMHSIMKFIRENYFIRTCSYNLTPKNIAAGKFRPCLEYHIKKCKAPCVGKFSEKEYLKQIDEIKKILLGDLDTVINFLKKEIKNAVEKLEFEKAHSYKMRIKELQMYKQKITINAEEPINAELIAYTEEDKWGVINYMRIRNGLLVGSKNFFFPNKYEVTPDEILINVLRELIEEYDNDLSKIFYTNIKPTEELREWFPDIDFREPDEAVQETFYLCQKNAEAFLIEKKNSLKLSRTQEYYETLLEQLKKELNLSSVPRHIECFDNSHIQGNNPVSSCVVFIDGKPKRSMYRVYKHEEVPAKPDDYAYMERVIYKRYSKFKEQNRKMPDLIILDGGKGQLSVAVKILKELGVYDKTNVISIAKRYEEIFKAGESTPHYLGKTSDTLLFIQKIRNEAHKTAVEYHRKRRKKATLRTSLQEIKGLGEKTIEKLFVHYKSIDAIKNADIQDLEKVIGKHRAKILYSELRKQKAEK